MKHSDSKNVTARRTKVAKHPGVYYRADARGRRVYEHDYYDSNGRRCWKGGFARVGDATASREDLSSRKRGGELVVSSRETFADAADAWLREMETAVRPRTFEWYETAVRLHLKPRLSRRRLADVTTDDVARLIGELTTAGLKPWTVRGVLTPLGRILGSAARRGKIPANPMLRLERGERPAVGDREQRILSREEIGGLLDAAGETYRPLLATGAFTGLRLGELLGLVWADVDFAAGVVRVRKQLERPKGGSPARRVEPKTPQAKRDVVLMPALAALLREHREQALARGHAKPGDFVFASLAGTPFGYRNVERRGLDRAAERAGLIPTEAERKKAKAAGEDTGPELRMHDLRHTYASMLVAQGANVVFVSRMLGHASPDITLRVYAHLFAGAEHADRTRDALEASFGTVLERTGGDTRRKSGSAQAGKVTPLHRSGTGGDR